MADTVHPMERFERLYERLQQLRRDRAAIGDMQEAIVTEMEETLVEVAACTMHDGTYDKRAAKVFAEMSAKLARQRARSRRP